MMLQPTYNIHVHLKLQIVHDTAMLHGVDGAAASLKDLWLLLMI